MHALTRAVPLSIDRCELSHMTRAPIDLGLAVAQHARYEEALRSAGCRVQAMPPLPQAPDSVFVEDTAVVLDEVAIITRPGAVSRQVEIASTAEALRTFRHLHFIEAPGTLDGGDVLRVGKTIFVGRSARTNADAMQQLRAVASAFGYEVQEAPVDGCLHLKSAVTQVAANTVLLNPAFVDIRLFAKYEQIPVNPDEPLAANALRIGDTVFFPTSYPRTARSLENHGIHLRLIDMSELAKAEAGLTCCSIIFPT